MCGVHMCTCVTHVCLFIVVQGIQPSGSEHKASVLPLGYIPGSEFYVFVGYNRGDTSTLPTEVVTALAIPSRGPEGRDRCWACQKRF